MYGTYNVLDLKNHVYTESDYYTFKYFYNSILPAAFRKNTKKIEKYIFQKITYNRTIENQKSDHFFFLCDVNTIRLEQLDLHLFTDDKEILNANLDKIYVTVCSSNELIFLHAPTVNKNTMNKINQLIGDIWNNISIGLAEKLIVIENISPAIDFIVNYYWQMHCGSLLLSHLNRNPEYYELMKYQNKFDRILIY